MAYKKLIKVSNVCQLLDKRKFPATLTRNGITWTNNLDGAIIANGTLTANYSSLVIAEQIQIVKNHKYALIGGQGNNSIDSSLMLRNVNPSDYDGKYWFVSTKTAKISVAPASFSAFSWIDVNGNGYTADNITFKPQLFDLTEMYGAGHEPTTVEEFRQDFPEEMYDYSPYCWLTSYKRVILTGGGNYLTSYQRNLTCKTKNLLDINSYNNINNFSNITINGNSILCVAKTSNAHVLYRVPTVIGEKYTVSNKSVVKGGLVNTGNFGLFLSDNPNLDNSNYLVYGLQSGQSFTLIASSEFLYIHWYVCYNFDSNNPSTIEINELQVNLGDTATGYVPYGYL